MPDDEYADRIKRRLKLQQAKAQNVCAFAQLEIEIEAYVDGTSRLKLQGNQVWWDHLAFSRPGRWSGANEPTLLSTWQDGQPVLNSLEWYPDWGQAVTRGLSPLTGMLRPGETAPLEATGQLSNKFNKLFPSLPSESIQVDLKSVRGFPGPTLIQRPSVANANTIILEFNDPGGGARWHKAKLAVFNTDCPSVQRTEAAKLPSSSLSVLAKRLEAAKQSRSVSTAGPACEIPDLPKDAAFQAVIAYEGKLDPITRDRSVPGKRRIDIVVTDSGKPTFLFLSAYDPVEWRIGRASQAEIAGVVVSGYEPQSVIGLPNTTPLSIFAVDQNWDGCRKRGVGHFWDRDWENGGGKKGRALKEAMGRVPDQVQSTYGMMLSVVGSGPVPDIEDVIFSDERGPFVPRNGNFLPAGRAGLRALMARGSLRYAVASDLQSLAHLSQEKIALLKDAMLNGNVFVLMEPTGLPEGLEEDGVTFIGPENFLPARDRYLDIRFYAVP